MKILLTILFVAITASTFAQAPQGINYQAVIRDNGGAILTNQAVGMKVAIIQTSPLGTVVYEEIFSPTTSQFGLVNVVIGEGTPVSGTFSAIDWSAGPYFVEVAADETGGTNYTVLGTQQLMSVPYSLYAETAENVANDQVDDADADPTNELQDISLSGADLSITNGSTVDLTVLQDGVDDADNDPTNELQDWTNLPGIPADLLDGDNVDDADNDPTNELQTWTTLPGIPTDLTDGDQVDDADADPTNELQDISLSGADLSITNGSTVDLTVLQDGVDDADNDPTNELQVLSVTNDSLFVSNGNGIPLATLQADSAATHGYINLISDSSIVFHHNALVEVTMKGGNGGKGGNTCNNTVQGKNGGVGAGVRVLINVSAGDTLNLQLGTNGVNGCSCCIVNNSCFDSGASGSDGSDAILSINDPTFSTPIIIAQGGTGGQGGYLVWAGSCTVPTVNAGTNGVISYGPAYNTSGCFVFETTLGGGGGTTVRW